MTYQDAEAIFAEAQQIQAHLEEQDEALNAMLDKILKLSEVIAEPFKAPRNLQNSCIQIVIRMEENARQPFTAEVQIAQKEGVARFVLFTESGMTAVETTKALMRSVIGHCDRVGVNASDAKDT